MAVQGCRESSAWVQNVSCRDADGEVKGTFEVRPKPIAADYKKKARIEATIFVSRLAAGGMLRW